MLQILTELAIAIVIHATIIFIADSRSTCVAALGRVRIPVNVRRIAGNLVDIIVGNHLGGLWVSKDLWDSLATHVIRVFHVSIETILFAPPRSALTTAVFNVSNAVLVDGGLITRVIH